MLMVLTDLLTHQIIFHWQWIAVVLGLRVRIVIWMGIEGGKVIKNLIDSLTPEQKERLFDNATSQFGDTNAAGKFAETNIGYEMSSARGPYGTPGADKPYVRRGYKDKEGKFVDFDNPAI